MNIIHYDHNNVSFRDSSYLMWIISQRSDSIRQYYPGHAEWFQSKVLPFLASKKRSILGAYENGKLIGYSVLKNDQEKKICTLEILPEYKGSRKGKELLLRSIKVLGNPTITCSEPLLRYFIGLFYECGMEFQKVERDLYSPGIPEYFFGMRAER